VAGIGFELRKLLKSDTYAGLLQAYLYAGVISSGSWVLSIIGVLVIGFMSLSVVVPNFLVTQFQVSVTYIMVGSLVLTGVIQLAFTRFIADRLFEGNDDIVMPNFNGLLMLTMCVSGGLGLGALFAFFDGVGAAYKLLLLCGFVTMCCIWVTTLALSGMKHYKTIVAMYGVGYAISVLAALVLRSFGLEGLLAGFVFGHFALLTGMLALIYRDYPSPRFVSFDFLKKGVMYPSLMASGLAYNLGVWIDKIIFWFYPDTGQNVIGPLRASLIYDFPIFLAYLSVIPGMAVFLVRMETDFVEYYQKFYDSVREGGTLEHIEEMRDEMVYTIRQGLGEIVKIQSIAVLLTFILGPSLLRWLGISELYLPLLYVDVVAAALQVVLLGLLNVFYYLDKRFNVLVLVLFFLTANAALTFATLHLGATFYGYGFALSLLATVVIGILLLDRRLERLEYETFMLQ
jgi:uncharacterized membrane protein